LTRKGSALDLIAEVNGFINELDEIILRVRNESEDLEAFLAGRRTSPHPLGTKFLMNRGEELQHLTFYVEQALRKVAKR
jgi:hypothetical protein